MKIRIILLITLFHVCLVAFPQASGVKGTVVSDEQTPIEFANVALSDGNGNFIKGTITDSLGRFNLTLDGYAQTGEKILTVSYLGYESHRQVVDKEDIGVITLHPANKELQEVVVKGRRSPYTMRGGALTANIQNSILKDAGSAMDILKQMPLVNIKDDIISIFGKGSALVYIDNREIRNAEELLNLSSKRIKKIDVITTPGAQYSASVGAVIKIHTIDPAEGFSGIVNTRAQKGKDWSESLLTNISYAKNKLTVFADYSMQDVRTKQNQWSDETINGEAQNRIHSDDQLNIKRRLHNLGVAAEYKISEQHTLGVKYDHSFLTAGHYNVTGAITNYTDSRLNAEYSQLSDYSPTGNGGNLNLFYNGKIAEWSIDANADYIFGQTKTSASYDNTELVNNVFSTVNSVSENKYRLGAIKLELSRNIGNSTLLFGTDYSKTRNKSFYSNDNADLQNDLPQTATSNDQDLFALFLNYKYNLFKFNIEMGLRYEFINQQYYINGEREDDQSKKYSGIFPTVLISRSLFNDKLNMSLSYRRVVNRPSYYQLRGDIQYNSPYSYEAGNPLLKNTYINDISFSASYSNLYLFASYKSYRDKVLFTIDQFEDKAITMSSFTNVDGFKQISIASIWDPTFFKIWNPEIEAGFEKQFLKVANGNVVNTYNRPYFYISLYNILKFPRDYSFVIQAKYWTSYNSGVSYEHNEMYVDAFVQKTFLNKAMVLRVGAENIFNTNKEKWDMNYNNVNYRKYANNDNRFVYVSLTYNFHNTKKYTGKGTGSSEQNRLNTL